MLKDDLVELETLDVAEPDDVVYPTELLEFFEAYSRALHHRWDDGLVGAKHQLVFFEPLVCFVHRLRRGRRFELQDHPLVGASPPWLEERPVENPCVTRADPSDVAGRSAAIELPADCVHCGCFAACWNAA